MGGGTGGEGWQGVWELGGVREGERGGEGVAGGCGVSTPQGMRTGQQCPMGNGRGGEGVPAPHGV